MDGANGGGGFGRGNGRGPGVNISIQSLFDREPPKSLEAEMSLLGSMILDPSVIGDIIGLIQGPTDFFKESHAHIYKVLVEVYDAHNSGDLVQISTVLQERGVLDQVGGGDYLVELANAVPSAANARHYAKIVGDKAKLRRLIDTAGKIIYEAFHAGDQGPDGARVVIDSAEASVFEIAQERSVSEAQRLGDLLDAEMRRIEAADFDGTGYTGVSTGYGELDEILCGLQPGELIIIAARPSMGKTALALNLAEQIAIGGAPVPGAPGSRSVPIALDSLP